MTLFRPLLGVKAKGGDKKHWNEVVRHVEQSVLALLNREGQHGWQADEPTDWSSLYDRNRVVHHFRSGVFGGDSTTFESVRLRLKRLVP
jgi:hypothetical protein